MKLDKKPCLYPKCKDTTGYRTRGLCRSCYNAVAQLVSRKKVTWEQLEKAGKVTPTGRGRPGEISKWVFDKP